MAKWWWAALFCCSSGVCAPLNVLVGQNKPPYIELNASGGFEIELLREIVSRMGHEAVFIHVPNIRTLTLLETGNGDIATIQPLQSEETSVYYSMPYIQYQNVAITRTADELTLQHASDLTALSVIAFQRANIVLGDDFNDMVQQSTQYSETVDQSTQVKMLLSKRVQSIVLDRNIFTYHYQQADHPEQVTMHELFKPTLYRAAFKDPTLQKAFDRALLSVVLDNWYQQLQIKYFKQINQHLPYEAYCEKTADNNQVAVDKE